MAENMTSFAELERAEFVAATQLGAVLNKYAESGAGISARVVIAIINRTSLTDAERADLLESAKRGVVTQERMRQSLAATQYQKVVNHLNA